MFLLHFGGVSPPLLTSCPIRLGYPRLSVCSRLDKHAPLILLVLCASCREPLAARPLTPLTPSASARVNQSQQEPQPGLPFPPNVVSYTTIAEVLRRPILFQGRLIRLKGQVGQVQSPHLSVASSTRVFTLVDHIGNAVTVETVEPAVVRTGQQLTVEGTLSVADRGTSSVGAVVLTNACILSSTARNKKPTSPAARVPPPHESPPQPVMPAPKDPTGEGTVF
jgi:hypothetical protein